MTARKPRGAVTRVATDKAIEAIRPMVGARNAESLRPLLDMLQEGHDLQRRRVDAIESIAQSLKRIAEALS